MSAQTQPTQETTSRLFTFRVEDELFGLDISKVLSVSQDMGQLRAAPGENQTPGFVGMIEFQSAVVPVIDFANHLHMRSGLDISTTLIQKLKQREQEHIDWLTALENAMQNNTPFSKARNPHDCAFGQWYDNYQTRDDSLREILDGFDKPHRRIHALADILLTMSAEGRRPEAMDILGRERAQTLTRLTKRFELARNHIRETVRQVLLYTTQDGINPYLALRIDHIHDVIEYHSNQRLRIDRFRGLVSDRAMETVSAYYKNPKGESCLEFDPSHILS